MESTRNQLINLLEKNKDAYISGQELSKKLQISRTAVWKHMKDLEQDGYIINAVPRKGYQVLESPTKVTSNTLHWGLHTEWLGKKIVHKESLHSTQILGHQLALDHAPHGTVVIADEQTSGKGRLDRKWHSLKNKGIWMSIILRPTIQPYLAPQLTLLTATVLAEVFNNQLHLQPLIKWPNDILINNRKTAGILTEMKAEQDLIDYIILGIGINVNHSASDLPSELKDKATSLSIETGKTFNQVHIVQLLLEKFEQAYQQYLNNGFAEIKHTWEKYGYKLGEQVTIKANKEVKEVQLDGIDGDGGLLVLNLDGSVEKLFSAEIKW